MRKLILTLLLGGLLTTVSWAQKGILDVVTLKNGSVLRGTIIEHIMGKSIKLQTLDGNIFVFNTDEVEQLGKDGNRKIPKSKSYLSNRRGYLGLSGGVAIGFVNSETEVGLRLNLLDFGYVFNDVAGIAGKWSGVGFTDGSGIGMLQVGPLFSFKNRDEETGRFEIKPLIGLAVASIPVSLTYHNPYGYGYNTHTYRRTSNLLFSYGVDLQYRHHLGDRGDMLFGVGWSAIKSYHDISATIGIAFRLK